MELRYALILVSSHNSELATEKSPFLTPPHPHPAPNNLTPSNTVNVWYVTVLHFSSNVLLVYKNGNDRHYCYLFFMFNI